MIAVWPMAHAEIPRAEFELVGVDGGWVCELALLDEFSLWVLMREEGEWGLGGYVVSILPAI